MHCAMKVTGHLEPKPARCPTRGCSTTSGSLSLAHPLPVVLTGLTLAQLPPPPLRGLWIAGGIRVFLSRQRTRENTNSNSLYSIAPEGFPAAISARARKVSILECCTNNFLYSETVPRLTDHQ